MWLELIKPVGEHKAGAFIEVADEAVARSYITAGLAKDGGDGPELVMLQRSLATFRNELRTVTETMAGEFREAAESFKKKPVIRTAGAAGGAGVAFTTLEAGESEADKSKGVGDFIRSVYNAIGGVMKGDVDGSRHWHDRLTTVYGVQRTGDVSRGMTESTGSSLGYTTPVIYESMIMAEAAEEQVFIKNARRVPLGAREVQYPALDQFRVPTAGNSAFFGGVQVYRKGENTQRTQASVYDKKVKLFANDLTAFFELSRDLMQDSTATLDAMVPQLGGEAIGWRTDWESINGTGDGQLYGLYNHPATMLVSRGTSGHFSYVDVFAMYVRLLPRAKKGAAWYVHPYSMSDVAQLKDTSGRNVYLPVIPGTVNGPIGGQISGTLMGLPVIETEKAATPGNTGDVNLFAMDRYLYGERSGLEVGLSEHFLFDTDQVAIRLKLRNDGKPQLLKPITLGDGSGSNQVSAFVSLQ
jgi:HK97 family phage major capsid protein